MTDNNTVGSSEEEPTGPVIRDKRRLDPETGSVRSGSDAAAAAADPADGGDSSFAGAVGDDLPEGVATAADSGSDHPDTALAAERLADLQRVQAEYINYKKRVDRDRLTQKDATIATVVESLMPVLDDIHLAREHGDLAEGTPFAKIADKLESTLSRYGLERFGAAGEAFDPMQHEALMHTQAELPAGTTDTTVVQVMQPGYRLGERIVRPARVAVADPQ